MIDVDEEFSHSAHRVLPNRVWTDSNRSIKIANISNFT